jgi:hypothetical protein
MSSKSELKRRKCAKCGKTMKRVAWYYRNNEYFCGTGCFKEHDKKKKEKTAEASA